MLPGTGKALLSTLALAVLTTLSALAMTSGSNAQQMPVNEQPVVAATADCASPVAPATSAPTIVTAQNTTPAAPQILWSDVVGNERVVTGRLVDFEVIYFAFVLAPIYGLGHRQKHG